MYKRTQRLRDLQIYDEATRGPAGAVILLATQSGLSIASIGAAITILAVTLDPFVQQLLRYPIREVGELSSQAITKSASIFNSSDNATPSSQLLSAINAGIWSDSSQFERNPTCPSGNCTYPTFDSVGWCSTCEDITSSASISGCSYDEHKVFGPRNASHGHPYGYVYYNDIPCGVNLDRGPSADVPIWGEVGIWPNNSVAYYIAYTPMEIVWMTHAVNITADPVNGFYPNLVLHNKTWAGVENPLMVFAHASLRFIDELDTPKGMKVTNVEQCVLSLCERTYNTSVVRGQPNTIVTSTNWGAFEDYDDYMNQTVLGWDGNQSVLAQSDGFEMYWLPDAKQALDVELNSTADLQHSASSIDWNWYNAIASRLTGNATIGVANGGQSIPFYGTPRPNNYSSEVVDAITTKGLGTVIGNVAASLTRLALERSDTTVVGTVGVSQVYVDVRWKWFILPCFLELMGILFLFLTIVISRYRDVHIWKSSLYALLYHGLEREVLDTSHIADTVSGMKHMARSTDVKLVAADEDGRLALRR